MLLVIFIKFMKRKGKKVVERVFLFCNIPKIYNYNIVNIVIIIVKIIIIIIPCKLGLVIL